jgi:hypothetical protein
MNAINVHDTIPYRYGATASESFARVEEAVRTWGAEQNIPTLFMLNHPTWPYYDNSPEVLIGLPQGSISSSLQRDGGPIYPAHPSWYFG